MEDVNARGMSNVVSAIQDLLDGDEVDSRCDLRFTSFGSFAVIDEGRDESVDEILAVSTRIPSFFSSHETLCQLPISNVALKLRPYLCKFAVQGRGILDCILSGV